MRLSLGMKGSLWAIVGMAVAGGRGEHSLGVKADGSIVAWGYNECGQCDVPEPNTDFTAVARATGTVSA